MSDNTRDKSEMKMWNRRGPKWLPCGTPEDTITLLDRRTRNLTNWFQSRRWDWSQLSNKPDIPKSCNLPNRTWWNALLNSVQTASIWFPFSSSQRTSETWIVRFVKIVLPFLNLCCSLRSGSMTGVSLSQSSFSKSLGNADQIAIPRYFPTDFLSLLL